MTEGGLCTLDERLAEVRDAEGGAVGVRDLEIDDRVAAGGKQSIRAAVWMRRECAHFNVDIVTGDDLLPADRADLDLHIDDAKRLGANVHLNETGVHRLVELAESRDETDRTYRAERPVRHLER